MQRNRRRRHQATRLEAVADYLFGLPGDNLVFNLDELTGSVAFARNTALALGRKLVINGVAPIAFTGDNPDGYSVNEPVNTEVTERGSGQLNAGAGTGAINFYNNGGVASRPTAVQTIMEIGKTYDYEVVISAYASGTAQLAGLGVIVSLPQSTGTYTGSGTATNTNLTTRASGSPADFTIDSISLKQTNIAAYLVADAANPFNGDITSVTIGQPCPLRGVDYWMSSDALNDYINFYSAELNSFFNPLAGTLSIFGLSDTWAAGADFLIMLAADANNQITLARNAADLIARYEAAGTVETVTIDTSALASGSPVGPWSIDITWDTVADEFLVYYNGIPFQAAQAIGGTWVGNLVSTLCILGAAITTPTNVWAGDYGVMYLSRCALTAYEIARKNNLAGLLN